MYRRSLIPYSVLSDSWNAKNYVQSSDVSKLDSRMKDGNLLKPHVLLAATLRWPAPARLAMALANVGCKVTAVCPGQHPLCMTTAVDLICPYYALAPLRSFRAAIHRARPDLIIPGDDLSTFHLHELHKKHREEDDSDRWMCKLIERSLGASNSFEIVHDRASVIQLARQEGVRAPKSEVIHSVEDLRNWTSQAGFPTVLKASGTTGGEGVRIVTTQEEAERKLRTLQAPPLLARALKRTVVNRDLTLLRPSLMRKKPIVSAQEFINGPDGTSLIASWEGNVVAELHFEVLKRQYTGGPATVLRSIENLEMRAAARKLASRLKLSGLYGFDFILETDSGKAHLLELNPRTTQVGHLNLGPGQDITPALVAALTGTHHSNISPSTNSKIIALFPGEWMREPASCYLQAGYHDVPWAEPELVRTFIGRFKRTNVRHSF